MSLWWAYFLVGIGVGYFVAFLLGCWLRFRHLIAQGEPEEEPDQVELPDHRIVDRELARIIGSQATVWDKSERMQYRPEEFDGELHCLSCQRAILPGQWFWDTPLSNRQTRLPLGVSFQTCLSCQPGDAEANTRG